MTDMNETLHITFYFFAAQTQNMSLFVHVKTKKLFKKLYTFSPLQSALFSKGVMKTKGTACLQIDSFVL